MRQRALVSSTVARPTPRNGQVGRTSGFASVLNRDMGVIKLILNDTLLSLTLNPVSSSTV